MLYMESIREYRLDIYMNLMLYIEFIKEYRSVIYIDLMLYLVSISDYKTDEAVLKLDSYFQVNILVL